jgi:hypothetical protein
MRTSQSRGRQRHGGYIDTDHVPSTLLGGQQVRIWLPDICGGGEPLGTVTIHYRDGRGSHEIAVHPAMLDAD